MNERIRELAEEARSNARDEKNYLERVHNREYTLDEYQEIYEKWFSELIVRECIDVVDDVYDEHTGKGHKLSRRDTPYQEIVAKLEEHFGVK
jgi:hypothetical protein